MESRVPTSRGTRSKASRVLHLKLSHKAYLELKRLADKRRSSMTQIVRLGVSLAKTLIDETSRNHKLVVTTSSGVGIKELVLPPPDRDGRL
jgi:hypothetical protein